MTIHKPMEKNVGYFIKIYSTRKRLIADIHLPGNYSRPLVFLRKAVGTSRHKLYFAAIEKCAKIDAREAIDPPVNMLVIAYKGHYLVRQDDFRFKEEDVRIVKPPHKYRKAFRDGTDPWLVYRLYHNEGVPATPEDLDALHRNRRQRLGLAPRPRGLGSSAYPAEVREKIISDKRKNCVTMIESASSDMETEKL